MLLHHLFEYASGDEIIWTDRGKPYDYVVMWVDVTKVDREWQKDPYAYITPGGGGDAIKGRYERFGEWIKDSHAVEMSNISYNAHYKCVQFGNGRHRFSWMRDHGVTALPIAVCDEDVDIISRLCGTTSRRSVLPSPERDTDAGPQARL